jgi:NitT/TauT family transport system permease protein
MKKSKENNQFSNFNYLYIILFLILSWGIFSLVLNKAVLPNPYQVFKSLIFVVQEGILIHIWVSFYRVIVSLTFSTIIAVPAGIFLGKNEDIDKYIAPIIYLTYPIPKVVFMPIILILLGIGNLSKIVVIALVVFYQILVTTRDAAKHVAEGYLLSVKSLGANSFELYYHVYLPGCLPSIFTALRLGLGTAMAVLFLVETYATQVGIGYFIMESLSRMAYNEMFVGIIIMGGLGLILYIVLDILEKKFCLWNE